MDFEKIYKQFNETIGTKQEFQVFSRLSPSNRFEPIDINGNATEKSIIFKSKEKADVFLVEM